MSTPLLHSPGMATKDINGITIHGPADVLDQIRVVSLPDTYPRRVKAPLVVRQSTYDALLPDQWREVADLSDHSGILVIPDDLLAIATT